MSGSTLLSDNSLKNTFSVISQVTKHRKLLMSNSTHNTFSVLSQFHPHYVYVAGTCMSIVCILQSVSLGILTHQLEV